MLKKPISADADNENEGECKRTRISKKGDHGRALALVEHLWGTPQTSNEAADRSEKGPMHITTAKEHIASKRNQKNKTEQHAVQTNSRLDVIEEDNKSSKAMLKMLTQGQTAILNKIGIDPAQFKDDAEL